MTILQIAATAFTLLTGVVATTLTVESRYEKSANAEKIHELLAAENETDRLRVNLELVKIKLEKYKDLANIRPLTQSEQIELRAVEKERDVILERLATKG